MIIAINGKIGSGKDLVGKIINFLLTGGLKEYDSIEGFLEYYDDARLEDGSWMYPYEIKKFADKLKDILCLLTGCTREQLEDQEFKNRELSEEWRRWRLEVPQDATRNKKITINLLFNSEREAWEYNDKQLHYNKTVCRVYSELPTYRLLLQWIGTDLFRNQLHENVWVNSLMSEYKNQVITQGGESIASDGGYFSKPSYKEYPNWIITDMRFPNELKAVKDRDGISIRVKRPIGSSKFEGTQEEWDKLIEKNKQTQHESETALDYSTFDYEINNDSTIKKLVEKVREILIKEKII